MAKAREQANEQKPTLLGKLAEGVKNWWENLHIGNGHAAGMGRLGLAELRQAASYGHGSVEQPTGPGIFGAPTQGEIAEAREGPGAGPNQEGKGTMKLEKLLEIAAQKIKEASHSLEHQNDQKREHSGREM